MKITMELKDDPRGHPPMKIMVDQAVHPKVHVRALVAHIKKLHPWVKIIDLRIDLH